MAVDCERARNFAADFERAKNFAARIINRYGLNRPPVDPEKIAENEGIKVYYAKLSEEIEDKVSGYFDPLRETNIGKGAIIINVNISPARKIFTIAHELGHVLLHHDIRNENRITSVQYRTDNWDRGNKPEIEQEADVFATHLLMPSKWIKKYYEMSKDVGEKPTPEKLSQLFGVSTESMRYRFKSMNLKYNLIY